MMGIYINKGNDGFQGARNGEYVDKSGLIAVINSTLETERRSIAYYYAQNSYVIHRELV